MIVAPIIGSPEASLTWPLTEPDCAKAVAERNRPPAMAQLLSGNLNFTCFIIYFEFKLTLVYYILILSFRQLVLTTYLFSCRFHAMAFRTKVYVAKVNLFI